MHARLVNDGPVIKYSMPASIHRISDLLPSDAVVTNAGYLPRTMTAVELPEVPGWPFVATQFAMTFPAEVRYCITINLSRGRRSGVSRIRPARANPGNERI